LSENTFQKKLGLEIANFDILSTRDILWGRSAALCGKIASL